MEKPPRNATRARPRVREALEAAGIDPDRFASKWCQAQATHEAKEEEDPPAESSRKISIRLGGHVVTVALSPEVAAAFVERGLSPQVAIRVAVESTLPQIGHHSVAGAAASAGIPAGQWVRLVTLAFWAMSPLAAHLSVAQDVGPAVATVPVWW